MSDPRRAVLSIHQHDGGKIGPHRDIRLFVTGAEGEEPVVHHFVGGEGLPADGKMTRWSTLKNPHLDSDRMEFNGQFSDGGRVKHEATHDASVTDGDGVLHLSVGNRRYAVSIDPEGHAYIQSGESVKEAGIYDNPIAQILILDRARAMGVIPPDLFNPANQFAALHPAPNPALQQYMDGGDGVMSAIGSAIGTGAKTLSLGFLGGLGAGAGWTLGSRLAGKKKTAADQDPADAPETPEDAPGAALPEDHDRLDPAEPAARRTAVMTLGGFGHAPNDPL